MTPLQAAKAHCANYQSDGSCLGVYYKDDLSVDWSRYQPRDKCLLADGKRCAYFEEIILPMRLAHPNEAQSLTKAISAYQRQHKLAALQRFCPECGEAPLAAKQKVCANCRVKRRQKTYRQYNSCRRGSNQSSGTTVEPIFTREKNPFLAENGSGQRPPSNSPRELWYQQKCGVSTNNSHLRAKIDEAKRLLPLPSLMRRLGYDEKHIVKTGLCPFHSDEHPSFSVFQGKNGWQHKCHVGCSQGDEIAFLVKALNLSRREAIKRYLEMAGFPSSRPRKSREYPESP